MAKQIKKKVSLSSFTEENFVIKDINFTVRKLNPLNGAKVFAKLLKNISPILKSFSLDEIKNLKEDDDENNIDISKFIDCFQNIDEEYFFEELMPSIFDCITFTNEYYKTETNLKKNISLIENKLEYLDIYNLVIRGVCVNFLQSLLGKVQNIQK